MIRTNTHHMLLAIELDESTPSRRRTLQERDAARETKRVAEMVKGAQRQRQRAEQAARPVIVPMPEWERELLSPTPIETRAELIQRLDRQYGTTNTSVSNPSRNTLPKTRTMRVHEIAGRIERTPAETLQLLRSHGEYVKSVQSTVVWPAARDFILTQIGA